MKKSQMRKRATRKQHVRRSRTTRKQRAGGDLRFASYGDLTIPSEFSAPGTSTGGCGCNSRGGSRTRNITRNITRKRSRSGVRKSVRNSVKRRNSRNSRNSRRRLLRGGNLSSFYDHPWISTSPPNVVQRAGIAWEGEPAFVSTDPSVSTIKPLSDVDLRTGYFNHTILTSKQL